MMSVALPPSWDCYALTWGEAVSQGLTSHTQGRHLGLECLGTQEPLYSRCQGMAGATSVLGRERQEKKWRQKQNSEHRDQEPRSPVASEVRRGNGVSLDPPVELAPLVLDSILTWVFSNLLFRLVRAHVCVGHL